METDYFRIIGHLCMRRRLGQSTGLEEVESLLASGEGIGKAVADISFLHGSVVQWERLKQAYSKGAMEWGLLGRKVLSL